MDIWFFDKRRRGQSYPRPDANAFVAGAEFVLKKKPANWIFTPVHRWQFEEGYWDDVQKPAALTMATGFDRMGLECWPSVRTTPMRSITTPWLSFLWWRSWHRICHRRPDLVGPGGSLNRQQRPPVTESPAYIRKDFAPMMREERPRCPSSGRHVQCLFHFGDQANLRVMSDFTTCHVGTAFGAVFVSRRTRLRRFFGLRPTDVIPAGHKPGSRKSRPRSSP